MDVDQTPSQVVPDRVTLDLLGSLAAGLQLTVAARACNLSEATARRRLRDLKTAWDAENTTVVIVRAVRLGLI